MIFLGHSWSSQATHDILSIETRSQDRKISPPSNTAPLLTDSPQYRCLFSTAIF